MSILDDVRAQVQGLIERQKKSTANAMRFALYSEERQELRAEQSAYVGACRDVLRILDEAENAQAEPSTEELGEIAHDEDAAADFYDEIASVPR